MALVATTSSFARADEVDDWVEQGIALRRSRKDGEALEYFRRAYQARATPRTRAQMALAEQAIGRSLEAETHLSEALKSQGDTWIDRNRDKLNEGLEMIRDHLGWLQVESQAGAELWVNEAPVGTLPHDKIRVRAAAIAVEVRAPEFETWRSSVDVKPRETVRIVVPLTPASAAAATSESSATPRTEPDRSTRRTLGWVSLGAGGLLLAEAAVAEVVSLQAQAHWNDDHECLAPGLTREQVCGRYIGRADTAQALAIAGFAAGGVAAGAGLFLVLTSRAGAAAPVAISVAPNGCGLSWRGNF